MMNMFPFLFSKFLKNSTALALITLSSFPAFAMKVEEGEAIARPSRAKRRAPTPMKKVDFSLQATAAPQSITKGPKGEMKFLIDNNASGNIQVGSTRFPVTVGRMIQVLYNIDVEEGGLVSLGLSNTQNNGYLNEVILQQGRNVNSFEIMVPEGERDSALEFRTTHTRTAAQSAFTINSVDILQEPAIKVPLNDRKDSQAIEQTLDWIKVTSKNTPGVSFLLEGHLLAIAEGERIRVPYDITVEPGAPVSIGLMRTDQGGWLKEVVLNPGSHKEVLEVIVPKGETKTSLQLFKRASGQTKFAINAIDLEKTAGEQKIKASLNDLHTSEAIEQTLDWIKVTSKNTPGVSFLLEGHLLAIAEGERIRVPYDITVEPGAPVSIGLMRTDQAGWLKEVVLNPGSHKEVLEVIVPKGETKTSLQLFKRASGQTKFAINAIDLEKTAGEQKIKASLNDLHTSEAIEQTPDWIKITSQNTPGVSFLLKGDTLAIAEGERIRVPYDITVEPGAPVSIGLMRTDQAGWLKEVVLNPGSHKEVLEVIVPKGETKTSLQLFKRESGQTKFAINAIDLEKEEASSKVLTPSIPPVVVAHTASPGPTKVIGGRALPTPPGENPALLRKGAPTPPVAVAPTASPGIGSGAPTPKPVATPTPVAAKPPMGPPPPAPIIKVSTGPTLKKGTSPTGSPAVAPKSLLTQEEELARRLGGRKTKATTKGQGKGKGKAEAKPTSSPTTTTARPALSPAIRASATGAGGPPPPPQRGPFVPKAPSSPPPAGAPSGGKFGSPAKASAVNTEDLLSGIRKGVTLKETPPAKGPAAHTGDLLSDIRKGTTLKETPVTEKPPAEGSSPLMEQIRAGSTLSQAPEPVKNVPKEKSLEHSMIDSPLLNINRNSSTKKEESDDEWSDDEWGDDVEDLLSDIQKSVDLKKTPVTEKPPAEKSSPSLIRTPEQEFRIQLEQTFMKKRQTVSDKTSPKNKVEAFGELISSLGSMKDQFQNLKTTRLSGGDLTKLDHEKYIGDFLLDSLKKTREMLTTIKETINSKFTLNYDGSQTPKSAATKLDPFWNSSDTNLFKLKETLLKQELDLSEITAEFGKAFLEILITAKATFELIEPVELEVIEALKHIRTGVNYEAGKAREDGDLEDQRLALSKAKDISQEIQQRERELSTRRSAIPPKTTETLSALQQYFTQTRNTGNEDEDEDEDDNDGPFQKLKAHLQFLILSKLRTNGAGYVPHVRDRTRLDIRRLRDVACSSINENADGVDYLSIDSCQKFNRCLLATSLAVSPADF